MNKRQKEDLNNGIEQINNEKAALKSCFRASEVRDTIANGSKSPNTGVTGFGSSIFNKLVGVLLLLPIIFGGLPGVRSEVIDGPNTYNYKNFVNNREKPPPEHGKLFCYFVANR